MELMAHTFGLSVIFGLLLAFWLKTRVRMKRICIVVLGDIGRSPRMQYHAKSFLTEGYEVEIVGYSGSAPLEELRNNENVKINYLRCPPNLANSIPRIISYIIKVLWQSINLAFVLFTKCCASHLLLQNPPAIPTIPVCWFWCRLQKTEFMIDWHNYAFSIMALNHGKGSLIVRLATSIESYFGSKADVNFCVTNAMKVDLERNWGIKAKVLYDRPADDFKPISLEETHELLLKLKEDYDAFKGHNSDSTILTNLSNNEIVLDPERPALLISSTSWTEDEDFSILVDALNEYESSCIEGNLKLPKMICVITGKGPLKKFYTEMIENKKWKNITVITPWLKNEDYPKLLASADLGVCLHTSSSGLDLPMKVVDMFGCGLPVCAYKYKCLHELVKHNENSLVFSDSAELAEQLKLWFENFPKNVEQGQRCKSFKAHLANFQQLRWHAEVHPRRNSRPIVGKKNGILAQEPPHRINKQSPGVYQSYIAASYVKYIESAGARAVPIFIGQPESYYEKLLSKINGVLFPGGATYFNQSNGYADAGEIIYRIAENYNKNGNYFPLWGTCLGFELMSYLAANRVEHRSNCNSQRQAIPLEFVPDFQRSKMFKHAPQDIVDILRRKNVTANFHKFCVTEKDLQRVNLTNDFRVISLNKDYDGLEFISSFEHVRMPFYGVQFHPEKNVFEWKTGLNIPHGPSAVRIAHYFADFFIREVQKNHQAFRTRDEETQNLIYNYPTTYSGLQNSDFEQIYLFRTDMFKKPGSP